MRTFDLVITSTVALTSAGCNNFWNNFRFSEDPPDFDFPAQGGGGGGGDPAIVGDWLGTFLDNASGPQELPAIREEYAYGGYVNIYANWVLYAESDGGGTLAVGERRDGVETYTFADEYAIAWTGGGADYAIDVGDGMATLACTVTGDELVCEDAANDLTFEFERD